MNNQERAWNIEKFGRPSGMERGMFTLKFSTANATFDTPHLADAIADALLATSKYIRAHGISEHEVSGAVIKDSNGNSIGKWEHK